MELNTIRIMKKQFMDKLNVMIEDFQNVTGVQIVTINVVTLPQANNKGGRLQAIDVILERI